MGERPEIFAGKPEIRLLLNNNLLFVSL